MLKIPSFPDQRLFQRGPRRRADLVLLPEVRAARPAVQDRIRDAFEILQYNQNLVQFADGKANTLIVINSIALATATGLGASFPAEWRMLLGGLKLGFLLASIASVLLCLTVVASRTDPDEESRRRDFIFFGDIVARANAGQYAYEYERADPEVFLDDLSRRNYRLALIADRKYRFYRVAQQATVVACVLWLSYLLLVQRFGA